MAALCGRADEEALAYVAAQSAMDSTPTANVKQIVGGEGAINLNFGTFIGSPVTVAHMLDELAAVPGVKGILLTLDDFREGLTALARRSCRAYDAARKVGGGLARCIAIIEQAIVEPPRGRRVTGGEHRR